MIIKTNLSNEDSNTISIEGLSITYYKDVTFHLIYLLRSTHISGYYLFKIDDKGLSRFNDVGKTDTSRSFIKSIETDDKQRLKIIGVDII
jgi:hypothetical protein